MLLLNLKRISGFVIPNINTEYTKKLTSIHHFGWIGTGFLSLLIPFSKNLRSTPAKLIILAKLTFTVNTLF
jgi:hypothetical protein